MSRQYELDTIKEQCQKLARKRALVSAGVAVVPVPFLDVMVDAGILTVLIPEISHRFGLAPEQIEAFDPETKKVVWGEVAKRGSQFIGLVVTRTLVRQSVQNMATKVISKQVAKFIPFGGQMVAAGLGYFVLRKIVYQHIDDCYEVAKASFKA
ncbi:MAG: hypothetical protein H6996_02545 [Moraxellaceae bacterium]|nr:hypothetical protein [Pseudomonadales bacterium]MCB1674279.1 hypothetical protein [Pseudomonadales bacterium]MCP5173970.1 hypothetical protein [Moraxellaceae bacterium]MCP5177988.1 hypothetical protein [Moraxellaceae bacterium]HQV23125.1 hypothetical protein [Agitococcus sp.]